MKCPRCNRNMNKGGWTLRYPNNPEKPTTTCVIWHCPEWTCGKIVAEPVKELKK